MNTTEAPRRVAIAACLSLFCVLGVGAQSVSPKVDGIGKADYPHSFNPVITSYSIHYTKLYESAKRARSITGLDRVKVSKLALP